MNEKNETGMTDKPITTEVMIREIDARWPEGCKWGIYYAIRSRLAAWDTIEADNIRFKEDVRRLVDLNDALKAEVKELTKELAESQTLAMAHFETSEKFAMSIEGLRVEVERLERWRKRDVDRWKEYYLESQRRVVELEDELAAYRAAKEEP